MKKYTLIIVGLLMLSPIIASASFDTSLKYGARGQAVIELQDLLTNEDCLNSNSTGFFGLLTLKAVKCFQTKYSLPSTGFFGVMSRAKANEIIVSITESSNAAALAETGTTTSTSSNKPKTFTLPNGTVIDEHGNVISIPPTNTSTPTPAPQTTNTNNSSLLSVALGQITVTTNSAYLSWNTNIPANSKVFLTPVASNNVPQIFQSSAGYSTQGFVNIPNLTANTQYSYTIEAINGTQDQKLTGVISTNSIPVVVCTQPVITINLSTTSLSVYPFSQPYPNYNYDVPVKTDVQLYSNCGFDPQASILVDSNTDRAKAYDISSLIGGTGAFGKVEEVKKYHNFNSKISDDGTTISFSYPVNIRTLVAGTQYISVSLGGKQVQVAEVNVR